MAPAEFGAGLRTLGYAVQEIDGTRVVFPYVIETGSHSGKEITLGFYVPPDFPLTCPSGPHISPATFPAPAPDPPAVHAPRDGFGAEFRYWSRPCNEWAKGDRDVKTYMRHIRRVFAST
jgi:hypothetical protein